MCPSLTSIHRFGGKDPLYGHYMAEESTPGLTYSVQDGSPSIAVTASASSRHCQGICQSGVCTISPRDAYCCFSEWYGPAEAYTASYEKHKRDGYGAPKHSPGDKHKTDHHKEKKGHHKGRDEYHDGDDYHEGRGDYHKEKYHHDYRGEEDSGPDYNAGEDYYPKEREHHHRERRHHCWHGHYRT